MTRRKFDHSIRGGCVSDVWRNFHYHGGGEGPGKKEGGARGRNPQKMLII